MSAVRIAVLCSGGGTNLQALIDAWHENRLGGGEIALVVSSSETAYALERAGKNGIDARVLTKSRYPAPDKYDEALAGILKEYNIDMVILAGYLRVIGPRVLSAYPKRIINVHPSLIPAFSGPGFYGLRVHEAALKLGVKVTGATVHYVSDVVDGGEILMQKAVEVKDGDTPEILQKRVMEQAEWLLLPKAAAMLAEEIGKNGKGHKRP